MTTHMRIFTTRTCTHLHLHALASECMRARAHACTHARTHGRRGTLLLLFIIVIDFIYSAADGTLSDVARAVDASEHGPLPDRRGLQLFLKNKQFRAMNNFECNKTLITCARMHARTHAPTRACTHTPTHRPTDPRDKVAWTCTHACTQQPHSTRRHGRIGTVTTKCHGFQT